MGFTGLSRFRLAFFCLFPALLLTLVMTALLVGKKTIAPVSFYLAASGLYEMGYFQKIPNHYISDIVNQFIPEKYYLTQLHPSACRTKVTCCDGFQQPTWGVTLPQGFCYPLGGVRPYIAQDSILFFAKFFSFFTAYGLSYLFLLLSLFFSVFYLFYEMLNIHRIAEKENLLGLAALGSTLFVTSFPVARDLQFDSLAQSFPFFALFLGVFLRACHKKRLSLVLLAAAFLYFCILRSTLQDVLINAMLAVAIILLFFRELLFSALKRIRFLGVILIGLAAAGGLGILYHLPSITIFLISPKRFIVNRPLSVSQFIFRRSMGYLFSVIQFFFGEFFSSFETLDPSKALGLLGAQEYFSYDWNSFFLNPAVSICFFAVFIALLSKRSGSKLSAKQKSILKITICGTLIDYLLILTPLYRYIYFRFHAFFCVLLFTFLFLAFVADLQRDWFRRRLGFLSFIIVAGLVFTGVWFLGHQEFLLSKVLGASPFDETSIYKGTFGFDPGFWPSHVAAYARRLSFLDFYSLGFLATSLCSVFLFRKRYVPFLIPLVAISGILLNTFHYNYPQPIDPFYTFLKKVEADPSILEPSTRKGFSLYENSKLMLNLPPRQVHESLEYHLPE